MTELAIVGAGPAGLTAAIYAARAGLDFVVLEQDGTGGGQIASAYRVENYPGSGLLSGEALAEAFRRQAADLGAEIRMGTVRSLLDRGPYKEILLEDEAPLPARAVIAATGSVPRRLGIPGEDLAGVSFCATCDGSFFKDKEVLVAGGGDTAAEDAIYLSGLCRHVTVLVRSGSFRAAKQRVQVLQSIPSVTILFHARLTAILGTGRVRRAVLDLEGKQQEIPADGVFIAAGTVPAANWLQTVPVAMRGGYVVAGEDCRTSVQGLFAAGDLRTKPLRQVVTAVSDGANAAASAAAWLRETKK